MSLSSLLLCLSLGALAKYGAGSEWCYTGCAHTPNHWNEISGSFCGNKRQSPIDIVTSHVQTDHNLVNFTFVNFSSPHVLNTIENNGHTVKCTLKENEVEVSGGGLKDTYSTMQFHFHWGDTQHHPGSEHLIDGHRYPMEMHIVSLKKGLTVSEAIVDPEGIAVLGFFINVIHGAMMITVSYCGAERQSPINIETKSAVTDLHLDSFTFTKFDDKHAITSITNTGHSVKCVLKEDMVEVSGGGLGYVYSTIQFHFHWGTVSHDSVGSEHTVNSKRYPMEMHIVNKRKDLTLQEAIQTPDGLAVLGFFIETSTPSTPTSDMDAWYKLTSYLSEIQNTSSTVEVTKEISINDLLGNVNRGAYFRYNGSLTTPTCNEAVVWTVFKESVKVEQNLTSPHHLDVQ
eukprot:superscaffoldBa00002534_g14561